MPAADQNRALQVEYLPLDSLTLDPANARIHKPAQVRQIAKSIEAFAFNVPVLIDGEGKVVSGHGRVLALRLLKRADAPVIRLNHLTPTQARAFAIAENRLVESSEWNEPLLALHLKELAGLDLEFHVEATGFSMGEIDMKIGSLDAPAPKEDPADTLPDPGPAVAKLGNMWRLGKHRLLCASALEAASLERLMGDERAAIVLTDPPYNVPINGHVSNIKGGTRRHREFAIASGEMSEPEFTVFLTTVCRLMAQMSAPGSLHFIFIDWRHAFALTAAGRAAYDDMINMCVWAKPGGGMGGLYRSAHELVLVFKHGHSAHQNNVKLGKFGRNRTNVWNYQGAAGMRHGEDGDLTADHPTPKPVRMIADALLDASSRGDIVLDPFLGTGTTLIAAERVGRCCRGLEIDPQYVDQIIRRWQRLTGEDAVLESTGETFNTLAEKAVAP